MVPESYMALASSDQYALSPVIIVKCVTVCRVVGVISLCLRCNTSLFDGNNAINNGVDEK